MGDAPAVETLLIESYRIYELQNPHGNRLCLFVCIYVVERDHSLAVGQVRKSPILTTPSTYSPSAAADSISAVRVGLGWIKGRPWIKLRERYDRKALC